MDGVHKAGCKPSEHEVTGKLPDELARILRDPSIIIDRDREIRLRDGRTLFEHIHDWQHAPSNTASAHPPSEVAGEQVERYDAITSLETLADKLHDASDHERACATGAQFARMIAADLRLALEQAEREQFTGKSISYQFAILGNELKLITELLREIRDEQREQQGTQERSAHR